SDVNSLVGSSPTDQEGYFDVTALSNGNYVALNPFWNGGRDRGHGAVTWGDGTQGVVGVISEANSLVGSHAGDRLGLYAGVSALNNGNYVVRSPGWNGGRGAATWGDGNTGVRGVVSDANSLVGAKPNDLVGTLGGRGITALSNGNYVVASALGVTWGNGSTGT